MTPRIELSGARVVVTGAGSGIGAATALRFAQRGSQVIAVDINGETAQATAERCGGGAEGRTCDVADFDAVKRLAEEVGPVDVLVNNAGVGVAGSLLETSVEDWDWLLGINLNGVAYGCYAFGPGMIERGRGHVVNIASAAAYTPHRAMAAYCAAKSGVFSFSQCLRADWGSQGIGVTVICPGVIDTPIAGASRMYGAIANRREQIVKAFRYGHSADAVGKAIVKAVERNQGIVPVGFESTVGFRLLRFAPGSLQALAAKVQIG